MSSEKTSLGQMLFGHLIFFLFCVAFPAFMTAVVPLSVTRFTRTGDSIRAVVSKRLLFVVPYRHFTVSDVISVNDRFHAGSVNRGTRERTSSSSALVSSEDAAFLVIEGDSGSVRVEVSPANIRDVLAKAHSFLADPNQRDLRLVTVANWKFGVFGGGLLSLLTLFYLYVVLDSLARSVLRLVRGSPQPEG